MTAAAIALCATALVAGVTGAWSPCGFSMVETLGAAAERGLRFVTGLACATFTVGAVLGGAITFGGLGAIGALLGGPDGAAAVPVAVAIAALAAVGEALGVRILPQIRRQVPEPWRRGMPLPLASALYGVLLGLGFTTFVLTWAVWALAGISVALGEPVLGAAIGAAFGIGRALPVIAMAPTAADGAGGRLLERMAERPAWLRALRSTDAVTLALAALLIGTGPAVAATVVDDAGGDPSAAGGDLVWDHGGVGVFKRGELTVVLPGEDPALGGPYLAYRSGSTVRVVERSGGEPVFNVDVPGADKVAVSERWLVVRRTDSGVDSLEARPISAQNDPLTILSVAAPGQIGRPALEGDRLVAGVVRGRSTSIVDIDLATGAKRTLRRGTKVQVSQPAVLGRGLLYVAVSRCKQELRLAGTTKKERVLLRRRPAAVRDRGHDPGHTTQGERVPCKRALARPGSDLIWSTALGFDQAYVTILRSRADGTTAQRLLAVPR